MSPTPARGGGAAVAAVRASRSRRVRRSGLVLGCLAVAGVAMFFVDVLLGSYTVTIPDFVRILGGADIPAASFIVMDNKLPRAVVAVLVGIGFGASGSIFQTMLRNPLASPDVVGVTAGASAAAVLAIVFGVNGAAVTWSALAGAVAVALGIAVLARRGGVSGTRLILVGIGIAAMLQAVTSFLLTRTDLHTAGDALVWLNGSLNNSTWGRAGTVAVALVVLLPLTAVAARSLHTLELGDDAAAGLGVRVQRARFGLLMVGVALAAVATAAAGPVAFVPLLAGAIGRRLLGGRSSLSAAALVGVLIMLVGEYAAANLVPDTPLPVGVVTGALGAPVLLLLILGSTRVGRGG